MFLSTADLEILPKPDYWALKQPMVWRSGELETTIAEGFVTDLASIPRLLRNILDVDGRSREPAILHDWLYSCQRTPREFADAMLRNALVSYGESFSTARVYWAGVRVGGWLYWQQRLNRGGGGLQPDDFVSLDFYRAACASLTVKELST